MSRLFSPKVAKPVAPTIAPSVATPAVQAASDAERRRQRTASGKAATMLTSGTDYQAPTVGATKLLGG